MKTKFLIGSALLLTLGSAVASTYMYGRESGDSISVRTEERVTAEATPAMIAAWKAEARSSDYINLKAPI